MEHAATLDLEDFEDAEFQDQLERARRQTSGRLTLLNQLSGQAQEAMTAASLIAGLAVYAPLLILLLAVALVPAFLSEAHFNARTYTLDFGRTPERRELDYVRQTAASVETAKEVKIFGLHGFLIDIYRRLAAEFYEANRALAVKRAIWGVAATTIGTIGYYAAYAYIVWRTLHGEFSIGDLTFLAGSFLRLRGLLESLLFGFSSLAGQALYLNDLFSFFETRPEILSPANARLFPHPIREGFVFEDVGFIYPGADRWAVRHLSLTLKAGEVGRAGRRERRGQDHRGEAADAALRPGRGPNPARRPRSARIRPRRLARQHGRHLPGFRALQLHRRRQHRGRPHRGARRPGADRARRPGAAKPTR
jgi:ATP-binding cassette subfamily B protein